MTTRFDTEMWICDVHESIVCKGGGGGGGGTQTQIQEPWAEQKPFLTSGFGRAEDISQQPLQFFPGSTVTPFSPQTEAALGGTEQRARAGSPLLQAGQGEIGRNLSGEYLGADNPFLQGMIERSIRPLRRELTETVLPGIASGYAQAGRLPGGPTAIPGGAFATSQDQAVDTYLRNVGDVASGLGYRTYGDERGRMMEAARLAPGMAEQDYSDLARLSDVGAAREQQTSAELAEQMARHAFAQREPAERLEDYMRQITGSFGGTTTTEMPRGAGANPLMQLGGAALLGAGAK